MILRRFGGLFRTIKVPGVPRVPGIVARLALREPRLVPVSIRWRSAAEGLGLVVTHWSAAPGNPPGSVLRSLGEEQGAAIRRQLGYGRTPYECARVVVLANRLYAIRAKAELGGTGEAADEEARVVTPGCPWSRQAWWTAAACSAFSAYEHGLVAGLNPSVGLHYTEKRSRGDSRCVGVYRWKKEVR